MEIEIEISSKWDSDLESSGMEATIIFDAELRPDGTVLFEQGMVVVTDQDGGEVSTTDIKSEDILDYVDIEQVLRELDA